MKEDNNDIVNQKSNEIINGKGEAKEDDNSKDIVLQNLLSKNDKFKEIFMLIGNNSNTIEAKKRKKGNDYSKHYVFSHLFFYNCIDGIIKVVENDESPINTIHPIVNEPNPIQPSEIKKEEEKDSVKNIKSVE